MTSIGLISDTHGSIDKGVLDFIASCDEVWHAGDIGSSELLNDLNSRFNLRAVYGNIDNHNIRLTTRELLLFTTEKVRILIIHIGGYPGRYQRKIPDLLKNHQPDIFVTGHSHILKVMNDDENKLLHMNPGAAGNHGFHQYITAIRFKIDGDKILDLEVFEKKR